MSANILKEIQSGRKRIMPLDEQARMQKSIEADQRDMNGDFPEVSREMKKHLFNQPGSDPSKMGVNVLALKRKMQALKRGEHPPLTKVETIALEKREKILTEKYQKIMVPREDTAISPSTGGLANTDFSRSVNDMVRGEMSSNSQKIAHELKNIRRLLHKDDPNAGNLEAIRPSRGGTGSH